MVFFSLMRWFFIESMGNFSFQPIGLIESCYKDKFGVPRQSGLVKTSTARLKLRADLQPEHALSGLADFSHVWLIWVFHQNKVSRYHPKVHPPRLQGENMGVFATRSPHRPNPIGLSLVRLEGIEEGTLLLSEIDLMDGTPILDIKPYLSKSESISLPQTGWPGEVAEPNIRVCWAEEARQELEIWIQRLQQMGQQRQADGLCSLIEETIQQDPRPLVYRGDPGDQRFQRRLNHAFRLYDGDVHFRMTGAQDAEVFKILKMNDEFPAMNLRKFSQSVNSSRTETGGCDGNDSSEDSKA